MTPASRISASQQPDNGPQMLRDESPPSSTHAKSPHEHGGKVGGGAEHGGNASSLAASIAASGQVRPIEQTEIGAELGTAQAIKSVIRAIVARIRDRRRTTVRNSTP